MFNSIVFIYAICYLILTRLRPDWALMLIIAALPSYLIRFTLLGIPFTLLELMILLSFASWIFDVLKGQRFNIKKYWQGRKNRIQYPFRWEIVALLLISFGAVLIASANSSALGIFKAYFIEPILSFILVLNIFGSDKKRFQKIIWPLVVSALAVSILAIYQKITGQLIFNDFWAAAATRRSVSFFGFPNAVGLYLGPIVVILSSVFHQKLLEKKNIKEIIVLSVTIILSLLAILFAQSEGALIGIMAAAVFYGLLVNKKCRWMTLFALVTGLVLIVSVPKAFDYVKHKATLTDLSGQIRRQQWIETKKMMVVDNRWIWGAGLSGYQDSVRPFHQEGIFVRNDDPNWLEKVRTSADYRAQVWQPTEIYMYPHNIFLNFWTELGLLGMLLFAWIIFRYIYLSTKLYLVEKKKGVNDYLILGLGSAMVAILVHGLVDVPYFKNDLSVFFWLLLASLGIYLINRKNKK